MKNLPGLTLASACDAHVARNFFTIVGVELPQKDWVSLEQPSEEVCPFSGLVHFFKSVKRDREVVAVQHFSFLVGNGEVIGRRNYHHLS